MIKKYRFMARLALAGGGQEDMRENKRDVR